MRKKKFKKDRKVRKGIDYEKLARVWKVLAESGGWLHIAEISRRTGINECTVRYYLDHYFERAIDTEKIGPTIKLRMVRLKPGVSFKSHIRFLRVMKKIGFT